MIGIEKVLEELSSVDEQLQVLAEKVNFLRHKRLALIGPIRQHLQDNHIADGVLITKTNMKFRLKETRVREALSLKYLENKIGEVIPDAVQRNHLITRIKDGRSTKIITELKRLTNK